MSKDYAEQLGQWVKLRQSTRRDKNVAAFLAVRDDAKVAIEAGHAIKTVWKNMREAQRIEFSYNTFCIYVKRFVRQPEMPLPQGPEKSVARKGSEDAAPKSSAIPAAASAQPAAGFTFNATPRKEDLL